ncbi:MAG TPA: hypothetical protein VIB78_09440 [Acidimicrobiia bacterium]
MTESGRLLAIYLRDHRAGAVAGRRLAYRLAKENPQWAALRKVAQEIAADEIRLIDVMNVLGVSEGIFKNVAAAAMETAERLKPNGRLLAYSPLSRVLEIESLISGVAAKLRLWASLRQLAGEGDHLAEIDFEELDRRALDQLTALASLHESAVLLAFMPEDGLPKGG